MINTIPNPDLTVAQTCKAMSLSHSTIWRLIRVGKLQAYKAGRAVRIPYSEVEKLRESNRIEPRITGLREIISTKPGQS